MKQKIFYIIICLILSGEISFSKVVKINSLKNNNQIVIDGVVDEASWHLLASAKKFSTIEPDIGKAPSEITELYMTYSKDTLYLAAICKDKSPKNIKTSMGNRDKIDKDDWVSFELDTFNDSQINYFFRANPFGVQADGILNRYDEEDLSPDFLWKSKGVINDSGYTVEIAIPFKSLRFTPSKSIIMAIGVRRNISRYSELISFPSFNPVKGSLLLQRQKIELKNIAKNRPFEITPLLVYGKNEIKENDIWGTNSKYSDLGFNIKYGILSNLILDVTYNPDFSHVESDAGQVDINLRHSLLYQEKREFFLEGKGDMQFGGQDSGYYLPLREVVNTRNIVDPKLGIKISGKIGQNNVISSLFAIDEYSHGTLEENTNFAIFRYKKLLNKDSFLGFLYTGKINPLNNNHVMGLDGRFRLSGKSILEFHAFGSLTNKENNYNKNLKGMALGIEYAYKSKHLLIKTGLHEYGSDFDTQVGYLSRKGTTIFPFMTYYYFYPKSSFFQRIAILFNSQQIRDNSSGLFESWNSFGAEFFFPRKTMLWLGVQPWCSEIYNGTKFSIAGKYIGISSQIFRRLFININFFDKNRIYYDSETPYQGSGIDLRLGLSYQPTDQLNFAFDIKFADFFQKETNKKIYDITIFRNKTSYQINKYLFLRAIIEYNSYYKRVNGDFLASFTYVPGTVLQLGYGSVWEEKKYNDNRNIISDQFINKERSFFFKVSYRIQF